MLEAFALLFLVGVFGGLLAGGVGLGGGIILAPLLLYLPPLLGYHSLDMRTVTGITMIHALCATCVAAQAHHRRGKVHWPLVRWMGALIGVASLTGALLSARLPSADIALRGLFALLAATAVALLIYNPKRPAAEPADTFSKPVTAAMSLGIGLVGGILGQSAAAITTPLLVHVLGLPLRVAIGSGLAITCCAAAGGTIGKQVAGQVDWSMVVPIIPGSLVATQIAARLSQRVNTKYLRYAMAVLIATTALKMGHEAIVLGFSAQPHARRAAGQPHHDPPRSEFRPAHPADHHAFALQ